MQEDIADPVLEMLCGALRERRLGRPWELATDIGPIIDAAARQRLHDHLGAMRSCAREHAALAVPEDLAAGQFFGPRVLEIELIADLPGEVFGPILHVLRWRPDTLSQRPARVCTRPALG